MKASSFTLNILCVLIAFGVGRDSNAFSTIAGGASYQHGSRGQILSGRRNPSIRRQNQPFLISFGNHDGYNDQAISLRNQRKSNRSIVRLHGMKRPILDTLATALFRLETSRVESTSEEDEKGRMGEPMEWSESSSLANQFSNVMAANPLGYRLKQFVADIIAGDYDEDAVAATVDAFISNSKSPKVPIAMFSFTTCPFCRRAKDYLDGRGIKYNVIELDELEGNAGNEIRAVLGKKTKRTSVPSIFVRGKYIGGCNDGPGLLPLAESGELDRLIKQSL